MTTVPRTVTRSQLHQAVEALGLDPTTVTDLYASPTYIQVRVLRPRGQRTPVAADQHTIQVVPDQKADQP